MYTQVAGRYFLLFNPLPPNPSQKRNSGKAGGTIGSYFLCVIAQVAGRYFSSIHSPPKKRTAEKSVGAIVERVKNEKKPLNRGLSINNASPISADTVSFLLPSPAFSQGCYRRSLICCSCYHYIVICILRDLRWSGFFL